MQAKGDLSCIHCGKTIRKSDDDHVIPKCLIRKPRPSNLWTVPACRECNNGFSKDEEYFRLMTIGIFCHSKEADKLFDGSMSRSMDRNPKIESLMFGSLGATPDKRVFLDVDLSRISRVTEKIARGLRYVNTGKRYPEGQEFMVNFFEVDAPSAIAAFPPDFTYDTLDEEYMSWEFTFFDSIRFTVEAI